VRRVYRVSGKCRIISSDRAVSSGISGRHAPALTFYKILPAQVPELNKQWAINCHPTSRYFSATLDASNAFCAASYTSPSGKSCSRRCGGSIELGSERERFRPAGDLSLDRSPNASPRRATGALKHVDRPSSANAQSGRFPEMIFSRRSARPAAHTLSSTPGRFFFMPMPWCRRPRPASQKRSIQ